MKIINNILSKIDILAINALGLVVALAWNSAFQDFFDSKPSLKKYGQWIYAILITIFSIIILFTISKFKEMKKENDLNQKIINLN
jgi:hypothetical protein